MIDQKKHLLTTEKQIEHLKSKGIAFDLVSEKDAFSYLQNESHFFKLIAYRKNYQKYEYGDHAGQYIHLELFGDLEDLTEIDRFLRSVLLQLSLDVEYYAKMKIFKVIEEHHEDGYQIVVDFLDDLHLYTAHFPVNYMVAQELCQIPTISKSSRNKRMSNIRLQQIVFLLYMHNKIVTSEKVHQAASLL